MIDRLQGWFARAPWALVVSVALAACGGDDDDSASHTCLDPLPACTDPTYPPTFDNIFKQTLRKTCGNSDTGMSCHYGPDAEHAQAGLVLSDQDDAYNYLLGKADGKVRVVPKNPECSLLIQRIESKDPSYRMPVGSEPLSEGVRCAIRQWIQDGAKQ